MGDGSIIYIALKDKGTGEKKIVVLSCEAFFNMSPQFRSLSLKDAKKHFALPMIGSDHLVLSLDSEDFTILFSNNTSRTLFDLGYSIKVGNSIFDTYKSFKLVELDEVFKSLEVGQSKIFDFWISTDDVTHYFVFTIYRNTQSILFTSSKNISPDMITNNHRSLDSSEDGVMIIHDGSFVFTNSVCERIFFKSKEEFKNLTLKEFLDYLDDSGYLHTRYDELNRGYTISRSFNLQKEVNGINRNFKVFCSNFVYNSLPSLYIRFIDMNSSDIVREANFVNQNELQLLRSFANIVTFTQEGQNNINWSSEADSILGISPSGNSLQDDLFKYVIPEDKVKFENAWIEAIINRRDIISKFGIKNDDGEIKYLYLFANVFYSDNGEITKINGFIQDISKSISYKNKYEEIKKEDYVPLESVYNNSELLSILLLNLIEKEYKDSDDYLEILEKTRNRLNACKIAYKLLSKSNKFRINLKTFFDRYIPSIQEFYDIDHVDLDWTVSRYLLGSRLTLLMAFSVNEILAKIFKYASPQVIETIKINISVDDDIIHLNLWTDLIFVRNDEINSEFTVLRYILKSYGLENYNLEVNDDGTLFDLYFA